MVDDGRLRLGEGVVADAHILHLRFCFGYQRVIFGDDIPHTRRGVCTPVEIAVGAGVTERLGPGGGVGVIRAPVALHQSEFSAAADFRQEARRRPGLNDHIDIITAQQAFQLLLHDLTLFVPVRGRGIVRHEDLDRERRPLSC